MSEERAVCLQEADACRKRMREAGSGKRIKKKMTAGNRQKLTRPRKPAAMGSALPPKNLLWSALLGLLLLSPLTLGAELPEGRKKEVWSFAEPDFLPVDEAFQVTAEVGLDGAVLVRWTMADGYYLYRHRFGFDTRSGAGEKTSPVTLGAPEIPPGKQKIDEYFGEVEVYYHEAQARVPVASGAGLVEVGVSYQGCADAGLCYPPETKWLSLRLAAAGGGADTGGGSGPTPSAIPRTEERELATMLAEGGLLTSLLLFFLGGIALAFTPCVLPMVPILSSIIVGEADNLSRGRALSLSVAYVLGMALTYAAVGVLVGLFGAGLNLQAALQSPAVLSVFAGVFVLLSLSMFGFYELQLPASWQNGLNALGDRVGGGKHLSVVVMGSLSSLVVSPCVSAPLAGALIYISTTGDAVLGGLALLALGLGMGVPLLVVGASGGQFLPKAGVWMNTVKAVFGVLLLGVAIWLLERVVPPSFTLVLWAALAIGCGVYLGAMDFSPRQGWGQLWKACGAFGFVYGVLLLIGAASGAEDPLNPLGRFAGGPILMTDTGAPGGGSAQARHAGDGLVWNPVADLADLRSQLDRAAAEGRPALLDLYADWCISCKVMERSVFPKPEVASRLARFYLLRADVTRNDAEDKALMAEYGLFGPPSLVFFGEDSSEMSEVRIQGEVGAEVLSRHLAAVLAQLEQNNFGEMAFNIGQ
ncbi:MAG: protein-disulfide reductase DsbD [Pseudomonadales bacterium]|nr:protein-disulfide reductase DsbD [Pseudomonadales bacterium]